MQQLLLEVNEGGTAEAKTFRPLRMKGLFIFLKRKGDMFDEKNDYRRRRFNG
jgi:hypothetical protein